MRKIIASVLLLASVITVFIWWQNSHTTTPNNKTTTQKSQPSAKSTFNKTTYSTTDPASLWVIVNKQHPVNPVTYAPTDLRTPQVNLRVPGATEMQLRGEAATALEKMFADAKEEGNILEISTAYRGYAYQKTLYDNYVADDGQASADKVSARPGYSEHQTGWAVDIRSVPAKCSLETCFGETLEGKWLAANAYKYGYILRYPSDKEAITGYSYEPWHFRYIGTSLSQELHTTNVKTLEEFFNVSGGTNY